MSRLSLTDDDIERGTKKREINELQKDYFREKGYSIEEMWECSWWDQFKNNVDVKNQVRTNFHFTRPLCANSLVQNSRIYNFPPIFKNILMTYFNRKTSLP